MSFGGCYFRYRSNQFFDVTSSQSSDVHASVLHNVYAVLPCQSGFLSLGQGEERKHAGLLCKISKLVSAKLGTFGLRNLLAHPSDARASGPDRPAKGFSGSHLARSCALLMGRDPAHGTRRSGRSRTQRGVFAPGHLRAFSQTTPPPGHGKCRMIWTE